MTPQFAPGSPAGQAYAAMQAGQPFAPPGLAGMPSAPPAGMGGMGGPPGGMPNPGGAAPQQTSPNIPATIPPTGQPFSRFPGMTNPGGNGMGGFNPQQQAMQRDLGRRRLIMNSLQNPGQ
ncbi:MAG TPA: hypothetical protein VGH25_16725 [Dongiaceae bacterium]